MEKKTSNAYRITIEHDGKIVFQDECRFVLAGVIVDEGSDPRGSVVANGTANPFEAAYLAAQLAAKAIEPCDTFERAPQGEGGERAEGTAA